MVDEVLKQLSPRFDTMYAKVGRPSIPPEQLLGAQLLQLLYSVRSERLLMEEIDYNLLFRWFVGLNADDEVRDPTVFTKNRDRLLEAHVAKEFLAQVAARSPLARAADSPAPSAAASCCTLPATARSRSAPPVTNRKSPHSSTRPAACR